MTAPALTTRWLVTTRHVRINDLTDDPNHDTRSERVAHQVRNGRALCGRATSRGEWTELGDDDPAVRCAECARVPDGHLTHHDLTAVGVTYRQTNHWTRMGWLHADHTHPGSGYLRTFPPGELAVAAVMVRLTTAGLRPGAAAHVARTGGQLAPGIHVTIDEET